MKITTTAATALAATVLLLPACSSGDDDAESTVTATEPAATTAQTTAPSPAERTAPAQADGAPARPARDQCVRLDPAPDGRYQVFDAGSAVVTFADNRLTLETVTPAEGWTSQVDQQKPDEVEIEFRRDAEQLDLELEVDNGRLDVKICNDDD